MTDRKLYQLVLTEREVKALTTMITSFLSTGDSDLDPEDAVAMAISALVYQKDIKSCCVKVAELAAVIV